MKEAGLQNPAVPSNGNAAGAMAAYASRAGMQSYAFIPQDCPPLIVQECVHYGAITFLVDGYIHDAAAIIEEGLAEHGWTNVGTMKEAGRIEGKKTMGLELAEQLNWRLPSVLIYPTGGGSGIIGMWKAFQELNALGWLEGPLPRFVCVQEQGCQPIVDAMNTSKGILGAEAPSILPSPTGMRVPHPPDLELIVSILEQSGGTAVAVSKDAISSARQVMGLQGISSSPEGSAAWAGLITLRERGWIQSTDTVVIFNTSHAMKYSSLVTATKPPTIRNYEDFSRFSRFH
ncbi:Threonine synthase [compost metagenome]